MNKILTKVTALCVGLAMMAGVGVAVGSKAVSEAKAADVSDTITASDLAATSTTYVDFSGVSGSSGAVYAGNSAKSSAGAIQMRSKNSNSGIVSTTSGGTVTSVTITVESGSNTIDVYGSNTAYTSASQLYGTVVGTKVGSTSSTGTITFTDSYSYVGIRSNNGAIYLTSVEIVWDDGQGGGGETSYTISYLANGGSGSMSPTTGSNPAVASCGFTAPSGMAFKEWNTNAAGTGSTYAVGAKPGADLTLYAIWQEKTAEKGSEDNPYTVAEARAAIDAGTGTSNVYATGIVSKIVTAYSSQFKNVTFNMSVDGTEGAVQLQAYREKSDYSSTVKVGDTVVVYGSLKKYNSTYEFDANCAIKRLTEPTGTKYEVIDRVDYGSLSETEVIEGSTLNVHIVPEFGYFYPESLTYVRVAGVDVEYTYVNGVVTVQNVQGNVTIEGACASSTRIKSIYGQLDNTSVEQFYGYYVGFLEGSGPMLMDGSDGIMLYNSSADVSGWTEGETIVHVTAGTVSVYNGLYEVKGYTASTVSSADVSTPVTHISTGSETALEANRLTNTTGYVSATPSSGSFDNDPATSDIKFDFTVGSHTFSVFYKKAGQTADVINVLKDSLANQTQVTLKGFTGWYNAFQLTMNGIVEASESYTAEMFAQDLLDQTDAVCVNYVDGKSSYSEFKAAFETIWSDLNSKDKYPSLPSDQKTILAEADRVEDGTVVERAMFRYDFLTGKYQLSEFINGRTPIVPAGSYVPSYENNLSSSSSITIIVIVAVASMTLLGVTLVIRKRKMN